MLGARAIVTSGSDAQARGRPRGTARPRRSITPPPTCVAEVRRAHRRSRRGRRGRQRRRADLAESRCARCGAAGAWWSAAPPPGRRSRSISAGCSGTSGACSARRWGAGGNTPRSSAWRTKGKLWPVVDRTVPLADGRSAAFERLAAGRTDGQTRDRGGHVNELWERLRDRGRADRQRRSGAGGRRRHSADRLLPRPADPALGRRRAQAARLQPDGRGRRARRSGRAHGLAARPGAGAGQADLLAGDAGGHPARQHRARAGEHQSDVRHDARLHPDAHRRHRDRHPRDDRGGVRARGDPRLRRHGRGRADRSPRWPRARWC